MALNYGATQDQVVRAFNGSSAGTLAITAATAATNFDLSANGANLVGFFGASGAVTYSGTLTPNANIFRLGGGGGTLTLNQTISGASSVIIGGGVAGTVVLPGTNTYTGGTTITGSTLQVSAASGAAGFGTGGLSFTGGTLQWGAGVSADIAAVGAVTLTSGTATFDTNGNNVAIGNAISGAGALTKAGGGSLTLNGAGSFTGATTISAGSLVLGNANALKKSTVTANAGLIFSSTAGGTFTLGGLTGSVAMALLDNAGVPNPITLEIGSNNTAQTYSGVLSGAGALTKIGAAAATLTGSNTYSGTTTVAMGNSTGFLVASSLNLAFAANQINILNNTSNSSALVLGGSTASNAQTVLGGGALTLTGIATSTNSQRFNGATIGTGANNIVLAANATANPLLLNVGALSRNAGGTLLLVQPTGTVSATNGLVTTTGTASTLLTDANGTAFAVVGTVAGAAGDWAAKDATNAFIVGGSAVSGFYTTAASAANFTAVGATGNADVTTGFTATAGTGVGTIRMNAATAQTLNLNAGTSTISTGGVLFGSSVAQTISNGTLRAGAGREMVFINTHTGTPLISAVIADSASGMSSVTYRGAITGTTGQGQFQVSGSNTYQGPTYIESGRVNVTSAASNTPFGTGANANVFINGNTNGQYLSQVANNVANHFYITGNGWSESSGALGAIRVDTGATISGPITLLGDAGLGAHTTSAGTISGGIDGAFNLTKLGAQTLILSGINTSFTGATTISAGFLQYNSGLAGAVGGTSAITISSGATAVFNYAGIQAAINKVTPASAGWLGITATNAAENIDLSTPGLTGVYVGAASGAVVTYTGTLTPAGNVYRLGSSSGTLTFGTVNQLTGARSVLMAPTTGGGITLTASNDYSGGTTINSNTLTFSALNNLGTGGITFGGGQLFWATGNTDDISSRTITMTGTTQLQTNGQSITLANSIGNGGAGTLQKNGTGTLSLGGVNTYTGGTNITVGTVAVSGGNAIPDVSAVVLTASSGGGTLVLNANETIGSLAGTGTLAVGNGNVNLNAFTLTLGVNNTGTNFYSGITGAGGITKVGTGTQTLSSGTSGTPANVLSYTGATTINGGQITANFADTVAPATNLLPAASQLILGGGTLQLTGKASTVNSQTFANGVTLNAGPSALSATIGAAGTVNATLNGITRNGGSTLTFTLPATGAISTTTANAIFAGGSQTILGGYATVGATTWAVSGSGATPGNISALATYSPTFAAAADVDAPIGASAPGALTVNSLRFNTAGAATVDATGGLTLATGGLLLTTTVGANTVVFNNGSLTSGNGADLIVIHNNTTAGGDVTFNSQVTGSIGLTKGGGGRLILANAANNYNGATSVNGGILQVNASGVLGSGSSASVAVGAELALANGVTISGKTLTLNGNGSATFRGALTTLSGTTAATWAGNIVIGSNLPRIGTISGNSTLTIGGGISDGGNGFGVNFSADAGGSFVVLNGNSTYGGSTFIIRGGLRIGVSDALPTGSQLDVQSSASAGDIGTFDLNGFNQTVGGLTRSGTTSNASAVTNSAAATTSILTVGGSSTTTYNSIIQDGAGKVALVRAGTGSLTLACANTFTGGTTVNGGTLIVGSASALGFQNSPNAITVNGGVLDLNGVVNLNVGTVSGTGGTITDNALTVGSSSLASWTNTNSTFGGSITDGAVRSLELIKDGTATLKLTGASTYTGGTYIAAGTLQLGDAGSTGSIGSGVIVDNGALRFNRTNALPIANTISGTGTVTQAGSGTTTVSGANTYTGVTTIAKGTLSAATIVVGGGSSNLGNAASAVILGDATNTGTLSYTGSTATYTRGFDVKAGGGRIDTTTSGQTLTVNSGAITSAADTSLTIGGAGNTTVTTAVALGATTGALTKAGNGTLNINSGAQTYKTLTTTLGAGTTNVNTAIGGGTTDVVANADVKFGSVSQTFSSLSIGAGATVTFTSGFASFADSGKGVSFGGGAPGSAVVPEPGSVGLLMVGALGLLSRRRRQGKTAC